VLGGGRGDDGEAVAVPVPLSARLNSLRRGQPRVPLRSLHEALVSIVRATVRDWAVRERAPRPVAGVPRHAHDLIQAHHFLEGPGRYCWPRHSMPFDPAMSAREVNHNGRNVSSQIAIEVVRRAARRAPPPVRQVRVCLAACQPRHLWSPYQPEGRGGALGGVVG